MKNLGKANEIIHKAFELQSKGNILEAAKYYQSFINQGCEDFRVFTNYGVILKNIGKLREAELSYRKAIELNPYYAKAYYNLGIILRDLGNLKEAELYYRKAIEFNPCYAKAYYYLGIILKDLGNLKEAELYYRKAIEINPNYAKAYFSLGNLSRVYRNLKGAELYYRKAIEINPNYAKAYCSLGNLFRVYRNLKRAELYYLKAIEINPKLAKAYFMLSTLDESTREKEWEHYLFTENILKNQNEIDCIDIYFARANILERKSNYTQSANMFTKANKLNRQVYGSNYIALTKKMKNYFKIWQIIKSNTGQGDNSLTTIFIVGLPRSGKTITESILASNKSLLKCGEDNALSIAIKKYFSHKRIPNNLNLYDLFIESTSEEISSESFISNTRPGNYIYTGLIASHIKNSKIIYCHRNPLDNIKEIYCSNLGNKFTFKTSITESAKILLSINNLMKKYKNIFNSKIYFLNYDQLVLNKENEIKSLLHWLGWEYDQKYLNPKLDSSTTLNLFNENSGINTKHLNSWKNYQELLKPAIDIISTINKY